MLKFKKNSFLSFGISYLIAIIAGVWLAGFLFHLVPAEHITDTWWALPWAYTVIMIGVGVGAVVGVIVNRLITKKE